MSYTQLFTEAVAVAADGIHSASQSAAEKLTGAVDLAKFRQVLFIIDSGTLGASGTLDFQVKGSATAAGTYTAIPNTSITTLVKATDDNKYAVVGITAEKVSALGLNYGFIKGSLLPGTAAANSAVVVLGELTRFEPASDSDATQVAQIVSLWR
ncbi:hypothetical protein SAMN05444166_0290 [Singulisphaera sp. GP187]|uniref:hypothetical protein n=1 Tax=Singulisphaera sp. GP187 TaxID=1882752 RepID=UPI00092C7647|nr:hypothetical protein [Singulisphaera sp. GP187]SIN70743.1 hypothetical protein SAMN05444166_0290 [Singulisphaera sp. GP187]